MEGVHLASLVLLLALILMALHTFSKQTLLAHIMNGR